MGTKANPGKFDCYANAEADEPLFVLLGRDRHAPTLVWLWSVLRELDQEDPAKVGEARDCCLAMMAWAVRHGRKVVGLGQSVLAGMVSLIAQVNEAVKQLDEKPYNNPTKDEFIRRLLATTCFESRS